MKRFLKGLAYLIGGLTLLLALFHLEENWRGKRDWERWRASQEAKGFRYDWTRLAPPEVRDSENFAKVPRVEAAIVGKQLVLEELRWPAPQPDSSDWRLGQRENLQAWTTGFKVKDLEAAFLPSARSLDELAEASRRSASRLPLDYEHRMNDASIPMLLGFRSASRTLRLRALARLQAGKGSEASEDVLTNLRMAKHLQREPMLIVNLLQIAVAGLSIQPIWEGVADHRWNEAQLAAFQSELERVDLIESHHLAIEGERVWDLGYYEQILNQNAWERAKNLCLDPFQPNEPHPFRAIAYWILVPKGWVYQNLTRQDQLLAESWGDHLDPLHHKVDAVFFQKAALGLEQTKRTPYTFMISSLRALMSQVGRVAGRQNGLDEALIACALDRYRLAKGSYPASLDALMPTYLAKVPCDLVNGQPLHYHPNPDGTFTLYSVGWDGKDDGGKVATATTDGHIHQDMDHGDWPWPQPAK